MIESMLYQMTDNARYEIQTRYIADITIYNSSMTPEVYINIQSSQIEQNVTKTIKNN